jgi:hypothetical protein
MNGYVVSTDEQVALLNTLLVRRRPLSPSHGDDAMLMHARTYAPTEILRGASIGRARLCARDQRPLQPGHHRGGVGLGVAAQPAPS